jgi:hypothetical protein
MSRVFNRIAVLSLAVCLVCGLAPSAQAYEREALNSVFVEGLGPGTIWSINYERMIIDDLGVRAGFSYMSWGAYGSGSGGSATYLTFPVQASYTGLGNGRHSLEVSAGFTVVYTSAAVSSMGVSASGSGASAFGTIGIGYRFHPLTTGFHFRVGLGGLLGPGFGAWYGDAGELDAFGILPWGYMSFGATF